MIELTVNNQPVTVAEGSTVAAAIMNTGDSRLRLSVAGSPRGALCGMGICFECRVTIDGAPHQRSCTVPAKEGMEVITDCTEE